MGGSGHPSDGAGGTSEPSRPQQLDDWADDIGDLYILEESPPPPLPVELPSDRHARALFLASIRVDDPRHKCIQGACNDHA
jgi:hypothetical protein